jgi:hypothetical protein
MAMPVVLEIKTKTEVQLPVEIWQRNTNWAFKHASTERLHPLPSIQIMPYQIPIQK